MPWIYLSPHLDDAALSCGGLIWEQTLAGDEVSIWTICAGNPPEGPLSPFAQSLHERWKTDRYAIANRQREDILACTHLGSRHRHLWVPDCIYRRSESNRASGAPIRYLYPSEESLFGSLDPDEGELIQEIKGFLTRNLPAEAKIVCPLSLGGHVDHHLVRTAAEMLGRDLWYYADFPYSIRREPEKVELLQAEGWQPVNHPISINGLAAWQSAVAAYKSQISTFWTNIEEMKADIHDSLEKSGGISLWKPPINLPN